MATWRVSKKRAIPDEEVLQDATATLPQPVAVHISDPSVALFQMDTMAKTLDDIEQLNRTQAMQREMEFYKLWVAANGFTEHDARSSPWIFSNHDTATQLCVLGTERLVFGIVSMTETIRRSIKQGMDYEPLDPTIYNLVVYHEVDIAGIFSDLIPAAALPVWKGACAALDMLVWALCRFVTHVGREQNAHLVVGFERNRLKRLDTRYDIPLTSRIAIAACFVQIITAPLFRYSGHNASALHDCIASWHPGMHDLMMRVNVSAWTAEMDVIFGCDGSE